jgi:purine nucleosidase
MKVLFDCDNTFGISGCDCDDGLALIYLLGRPDIDIAGITTTFGNSNIETVYNASIRLLSDLSRQDIPLIKGAAGPNKRESDAAIFLADLINSHPHTISLLATGPLTNLYAAWKLDKDLFTKVNSVSLMGGTTEPLIINGKKLDEMNFSYDYEASYNVIVNARNLAITTGNNCLRAPTKRTNHIRRLKASSNPIAVYLLENTAYWFDHEEEWGMGDGIYKWDVLAAAYMAEAGLFYADTVQIKPDMQSMCIGSLMGSGKNISVTLPVVKDPEAIEDAIYSAYLNVQYEFKGETK